MLPSVCSKSLPSNHSKASSSTEVVLQVKLPPKVQTSRSPPLLPQENGLLPPRPQSSGGAGVQTSGDQFPDPAPSTAVKGRVSVSRLLAFSVADSDDFLNE
ncbi:hypothetical protein LWI28_021816 [Acer negundo]|uniref:Uncharacterized protein n=1 Tax=Acer negundo TaxID=4023 RepID=A0AAD5IGL5_ACENE|nr:hypothetical protein LWI28_021816 [Acer negundo]